MKLNRTKILVISLVVITLALGGAALYIANRLQNQIQTPSSAATTSSSSSSKAYPCKVIYYKDAGFTQVYTSTDKVTPNVNLELYISRTATGAFTNVGVNNVSLRKGTTRIPGIQTTGNNYHVTVPADQIVAGANVFEFGYNIVNNNVATGDWCEPFTITGSGASSSATDPICKDMVIGKGTTLAKKNSRSDAILLAPGETLTVKYTLGNVTAGETRRIHLKNEQNFRVATDMNQELLVSYSNTSNNKLLATAVASGADQTFTYTLTYADLFQNDTTALGFPYTPAETPQWASGSQPNIIQINGTVKKATSTSDGTFDKNCISYVRRTTITPVATTAQTSNAVCVGMTVGKNGGTQTKKNTRDNPLVVSSGDTINITHTLSGLSSTENSRVLRIYNAQNLSTEGNNDLNNYTSYNDSAATYQIASKVADGSNSKFTYTLTYAQLFKADTSTRGFVASPAETPQWSTGQTPNLIKVAVPVKPFTTGVTGTFDSNCIGYFARTTVSLASSGGSGLPSTDLSALNIFELIAGAIFLFGGITIMKYRSRFENI